MGSAGGVGRIATIRATPRPTSSAPPPRIIPSGFRPLTGASSTEMSSATVAGPEPAAPWGPLPWGPLPWGPLMGPLPPTPLMPAPAKRAPLKAPLTPTVDMVRRMASITSSMDW
ncbi:hypothetical protein MYXA107069_31900 [Myxococcus xanthus]